MKFSHIADVHIGAYGEPKLSGLILKNFSKAVDISIQQKVDFVIIAGDFFNVALPSLDNIKYAILELKKLKKHNIPVYTIAGSHDYSASGKTFLEILEHAGMLMNVLKGEQDAEGKINLKFTVDEKTGAKITGLLGKKNLLEKNYYENLNRENLEKEQGFKIFIFHTALSELKPEDMSEMESIPVSLLPKNFDYYAGGHVHIVEEVKLEGYNRIVYPGPIFPVNFSELEKLKHGGFVIFEDGIVKRIKLDEVSAFSLSLDCTNLTSSQITQKIISFLPTDLTNKILTLRLYGNVDIKVSDIDFNSILQEAEKRNVFYVMRNTAKLQTKQLRKVKTNETTPEKVEKRLLTEFSSNFKFKETPIVLDEKILKQLLELFSQEKLTTQEEYEKELIDKAKKIFKI